jgi:hypothetical protein
MTTLRAYTSTSASAVRAIDVLETLRERLPTGAEAFDDFLLTDVGGWSMESFDWGLLGMSSLEETPSFY